MTCSHCRMEVPTGANKCPYCLESPMDGYSANVVWWILGAVFLFWLFGQKEVDKPGSRCYNIYINKTQRGQTMQTEQNSRDRALELVEEGMVSAEDMLTAALKYMSTDDVADMLDANELSDRFMMEEV